MKRSWIGVVIIIFLCISVYLTLYNTGYTGKALAAQKDYISLDKLIEQSGCQWLQTDIYAWAEFDEDYAINEDLAHRISEFFNLVNHVDLSTTKCGKNIQVKIRGNDQKGLMYDIIITNKTGTHIIINVMDNHLFEDIPIITQKIKDFYRSINAIPSIYTTLTGAFPGQLSKVQRKSIIENLVNGLEARDIQTMEDLQLISIAGYSPLIDTAPMDKINFQVASRYNEYRDKTYLWIGTPVITIEY